MFKLINLCIVFGLLAALVSCNPECSSSGNITLSTDFNPPGFEVLLTATPLSSLKNKKVSFGKTEAKTRFIDTLGLIFTVPEGFSGKTTIKIEDDDCVEYVDFDVKSKDFYTKNPDYVFPVSPEIIIPTISTFVPPSINNAWLCPWNTDYCIWFKVKIDSTKNANGKYDVFDTQYIDKTGNQPSGEKCTSCNTCPAIGSNQLYNENPMYGIYDRDHKTIHIWIDRSSKGNNLGIEEFEGRLMDTAYTKYSAAKFKIQCNPTDFARNKHMMVLTSKKTGRQTIVFQKP